ncbi:MAG: DUF2889 domain-containing protein [Acidimicrobiales bacterium]
MSTMAHPARGPHHTVEGTPALVSGAVRRTTSVDVTRPEGFGRPVLVIFRGRDAAADGEDGCRDLDVFEGRLTVDEPSGVIAHAAVAASMGVPDLEGLSLRRGWGRALAAHTASGRALLHSALEDLGGAFLVSGYASLRAGLLATAPGEGPSRAAAQADVCVGWASGSDVVRMLRDTGAHAVPIGPHASPVLLTPGPWHPVDGLEPGTVRRIRRLDVVPGPDGYLAQAHFRDSYASDEPEMVLHEYLVDVVVDADRRVLSVEVDARVLPWDTCPGAVASAQAVVGLPLDQLAARVRDDLRGPSTCTHLTSTLRTIADLEHLIGITGHLRSTL